MVNSKKKIVIVGATSAIAEHCARLWSISSPVDLFLVVRNVKKAEIIAADLQVRSPLSTIRVIEADFIDPIKISRLATELASDSPIDIILIAHGSLLDQHLCQNDLNLCAESLFINGNSPVIFAEAFASELQRAGTGTLAVISSVAGDRGRKSNYIYGAAKGLVTRYVQGLQHRFANTLIKIVLIKPGPTDTPMTAVLKEKGARLTPVEQVASNIVKGVEQGRLLIYAPIKWRLIMMIIRHLPTFIFNKINI